MPSYIPINIEMAKNYVSNPNIICKNCETKFVGNFCPNCGQSTKDYDKPFGFIMYDLMGNIFAFDTRLWRTLVTILFKPGKMAHEFIIGHRIRYMPPFRFYIFVSFVFFMLLNSLSNKNIEENEESWFQVGNKPDSVDLTHDSVKNVQDSLVVFPTKMTYNRDSGKMISILDTINIANSSDDDTIMNTDVEDIQNNPEKYAQSYIKYFSWSLFLLMPVYALLLLLFFHRKYKNYIGHLIFAVNQHAFLFLMLSLMIGFNMLFPNYNLHFLGWIILTVPLYSIIGAKKLYMRGWTSTIFRLITIGFLYMLALSTCAILVILLTFL